jgi:hypothetical protein
LIVNRPGTAPAAPGAKVPLVPMMTLPPMVPAPPSVAPPATPMSPSVEPLTSSVPCWTDQGVEAVAAPVRVQVLLPTLEKASKLRYCAAGPMVETSKLAFVLPPRRNSSFALAPATTLPWITEPALSSSSMKPVEPATSAIASVWPAPARIVPLLLRPRLADA